MESYPSWIDLEVEGVTA